MQDDAETRAAIRLVRRLSWLALAVYLATGLLVREDSALVTLGANEQVELALLRAHRLDRSARHGDKPVVWLLGSSIVREGLDAHGLEAALPDVGVESFGIDRAAPIFTWAMLRHLPLRAGDTVVTGVSYDQFRATWLDHYQRPSFYLRFLLDADQLARVTALPVAERIELGLASAPPRDFWRWRDPWRQGLHRQLAWWTGQRRTRPEGRPLHWQEPFRTFDEVPRYRTMSIVEKNRMALDELALAPGQVNWDGLQWLREDCERLGVRLLVVHLPSNPEYYDRFVPPELPAAFHAHFADWPEYRRLTPLPAGNWLDFKHANHRGRRRFTAELARVLAAEAR